MASILRNLPLRRPSVLRPKSLRRILQITKTAKIFYMINGLAVESGREFGATVFNLDGTTGDDEHFIAGPDDGLG